MNIDQNRYPLPDDPTEAIELQRSLVNLLQLSGDPSGCNLVAGVDCSSFGNTGTTVGAVVVWDRRKGKVVDQATAVVHTDFLYIPGLLGFREIPALLAAFHKLQTVPEVVICDGQGRAHMRGFGIACHLGLYLDLPTVGCGKTHLVGSYIQPENTKGHHTVLSYKNERVGDVLRTRSGVSPVFVSPGHLCGYDEAVMTVLANIGKYRLPDPIRAAHQLCKETLTSIRDQKELKHD